MKKGIIVLVGFLIIIPMMLIGIVLSRHFLDNSNNYTGITTDATYDATIYDKLDRTLGTQRSFYEICKI